MEHISPCREHRALRVERRSRFQNRLQSIHEAHTARAPCNSLVLASHILEEYLQLSEVMRHQVEEVILLEQHPKELSLAIG